MVQNEVTIDYISITTKYIESLTDKYLSQDDFDKLLHEAIRTITNICAQLFSYGKYNEITELVRHSEMILEFCNNFSLFNCKNYIYNICAYAYMKLDSIQLAGVYIERAIKVCKLNFRVQYQIITLLNAAILSNELHNYKLGLKRVIMAINCIKSIKINCNVILYYELLAIGFYYKGLLNKQLGKYKCAFVNYELAIETILANPKCNFKILDKIKKEKKTLEEFGLHKLSPNASKNSISIAGNEAQINKLHKYSKSILITNFSYSHGKKSRKKSKKKTYNIEYGKPFHLLKEELEISDNPINNFLLPNDPSDLINQCVSSNLKINGSINKDQTVIRSCETLINDWKLLVKCPYKENSKVIISLNDNLLELELINSKAICCFRFRKRIYEEVDRKKVEGVWNSIIKKDIASDCIEFFKKLCETSSQVPISEDGASINTVDRLYKSNKGVSDSIKIGKIFNTPPNAKIKNCKSILNKKSNSKIINIKNKRTAVLVERESEPIHEGKSFIEVKSDKSVSIVPETTQDIENFVNKKRSLSSNGTPKSSIKANKDNNANENNSVKQKEKFIIIKKFQKINPTLKMKKAIGIDQLNKVISDNNGLISEVKEKSEHKCNTKIQMNSI